MSFLDTNVLIDVLSADPRWSEWSKEQLRREADRGNSLMTNGVVYAELAVGFAERPLLDRFLQRLEVALAPIPQTAFFLAGQAFAAYCRRSGARSTILPDFIIGAHAADLGVPLVTRDPRRYRTYFPDLKLVSP